MANISSNSFAKPKAYTLWSNYLEDTQCTHVDEFKYVCFNCKEFFCETCSEEEHNRPKGAKHLRMDYQDFKKEEIILNYHATQKQIENDAKNTLFGIEMNPETNRYEINCGPRWSNTEFTEDEAFVLVSFVGPSGTGKSTLLRTLCSSENKPLPGRRDGKSMTKDVKAYPSIIGNNRLLFVDSEGIGGTETTHQNQSHQNFLLRTTTGIAKKFIPSGENQIPKNHFIDNVYPRVLYLFSNVLVFTFQEVKQKSTIIDYLTSYAYAGTYKSMNQSIRPHLIIVCNKYESHETIESATASFLEEPKALLLLSYYKSINVIHIPNAEIDLKLFVSRKRDLKQLVSIKITESLTDRMNSNLIRTKNQTLRLMNVALNKFSQDPKAKFDLFALESVLEPLKDDIVNHIYQYFLTALSHFKAERYSKTKVFPDGHAAKVFYQTPASINIFQKAYDATISGCNRLFREQFKEAKFEDVWFDFEKKLEEIDKKIDQNRPCAFIFNENGQTYQCCNVKGRHSFHSTFETYQVPVEKNGLLGWLSKETMNVSYREEGSFVEDKSLESKSLKSNVKTELEHQNVAFDNIIPDWKTDKVCVSCIMVFPNLYLECGHFLCSKCLKNSQCPICDFKVVEKIHTIPPNAGYRILSLDGGGIKGVIELAILSEIQRLLYNIPIHCLFDYIIGTSTGSLVASFVTMKNLRPIECISLLKEYGKQAFKHRILTGAYGIGHLMASIYGSKYKRKPLHDSIETHLGESSKKEMYRSYSKTKIAFTSCLPGGTEVGLDLILFTNYLNQHRVNIDYKSPVINAIEASTAAGFFFPPFKTESQTYTDGGMLENCPALVSLQECHVLWPDRICDFLTSIGTGCENNKPFDPHSNTLTFLTQCVDLLTNGEKRWNDALNFLNNKKDMDSLAVRLNPPLKNDYQIDDYTNIDAIVQETLEYCSNSVELITISNKILSSLYYVNYRETEKSIKFKVICRLGYIPESLVIDGETDNQGLLLQFPIHVRNQKDKSIIKCTPYYIGHSKSQVEFGIDGLPSNIDLSISIYCNIKLYGKNTSNGSLISGCPFVIQRN
ncbi:hypothetical protein CYY_002255 [Polysphondylium violaceum]|uniref:Patatin family protein n=1 Tax=Polysphondylium violaceum TaxID=133409 RepID=A0A8J4Q1M1_9MYCE|nr:hypothetical protein CYY_002255 [Polysphondylium violaceum]